MSMTPVISSRDNPLIKELRRLAQDGSVYRKSGRVWVEGEHLCLAALEKAPKAQKLPDCAYLEPVLQVFSESKWGKCSAEYAQAAIKKIVIADALWREVSALESPAGQGLVLQLPASIPIQNSLPTVILDRLQDPGNVGSILRSAAAFGFSQIIALKGTAALWAPKVLRAGMGAHFSLHLIESANLKDLEQLQRPLAVTSSHRGQYLHKIQALSLQKSLSKEELLAHDLPDKLPENVCKNSALNALNWALGHEGQGVSMKIEEMADFHVKIAQPGGQESLNVAAAAAIVLHASSMPC